MIAPQIFFMENVTGVEHQYHQNKWHVKNAARNTVQAVNMRTSVHMWGIDELLKITERFSNKKLYERLLREIVYDAAELMRNFAPVDTGLLEDMIKVIKIGPHKYMIVVDVPYAEYMEWGTKFFPVPTDPTAPKVRTSKSGKTAYHPFMRLAVYLIDDEFDKYFRKILLYKG